MKLLFKFQTNFISEFLTRFLIHFITSRKILRDIQLSLGILAKSLLDTILTIKIFFHCLKLPHSLKYRNKSSILTKIATFEVLNLMKDLKQAIFSYFISIHVANRRALVLEFQTYMYGASCRHSHMLGKKLHGNSSQKGF